MQLRDYIGLTLGRSLRVSKSEPQSEITWQSSKPLTDDSAVVEKRNRTPSHSSSANSQDKRTPRKAL